MLTFTLEENPLKQAVLNAIVNPKLTSSGIAYVAKCLHSADSLYRVDGVPTAESVPTAAIEWTTSATVAAPASAAYNLDVHLAPTPLSFAHWHTEDGATSTTGTLYNDKLGGTAPFGEYGATARTWLAEKLGLFAANVTRYRLMYASATVSLSANMTGNEGTAYATQRPLVRQKLSYNPINLTATCLTSGRKVHLYNPTPITTQSMMDLRGSVSTEARNGFYMLLKPTDDAHSWHYADDAVNVMAATTMPNVYNATPILNGTGAAAAIADLYGAAASSLNVSMPFGPEGAMCTPTATSSGATTSNAIFGHACYPPTWNNAGLMRFIGLNSTCKVLITVRVGYELVVPPTSIFNGLVSAPVPYDPEALATVYAVMREYLAAYPAKDNFFGAILSGLKSIGSKLLPSVFGAVRDTIMPAPSATPAFAPATPAYTAVPLTPPPAPVPVRMRSRKQSGLRQVQTARRRIARRKR